MLFADLGTRIYYTQHGGYDTHSGELVTHKKLWDEVAGAIADFYDDLKEHGRENDVAILVFSEFGRRIKDNRIGLRPRLGRRGVRDRRRGQRGTLRRVPVA